MISAPNAADARQVLEVWREEIMARLNRREDIEITRHADRLDEALGICQREIAAGEIGHDTEVLREIQAAIARIEDGSYGICVNCGEPIPEKRLKALPWAPRCVACQKLAEEAVAMLLLTPEELAAQLQVSQSALAKWRMRNKGPRHIKVGSLVRYSNEAVLEWLEECESNGDTTERRELALPVRDRRARVVRRHRLGGHRTKSSQGTPRGGGSAPTDNGGPSAGTSGTTEAIH